MDACKDEGVRIDSAEGITDSIEHKWLLRAGQPDDCKSKEPKEQNRSSSQCR